MRRSVKENLWLASKEVIVLKLLFPDLIIVIIYNKSINLLAN
jgi:hypothetical protein